MKYIQPSVKNSYAVHLYYCRYYNVKNRNALILLRNISAKKKY